MKRSISSGPVVQQDIRLTILTHSPRNPVRNPIPAVQNQPVNCAVRHARYDPGDVPANNFTSLLLAAANPRRKPEK